MLMEDGYLIIGAASLAIMENSESIPPEKYNHYGYCSTGETFALGERVVDKGTGFKEGDVIGFVLDLDNRLVVFYKNGRQVAELRNMSEFMEYSPCVVFGNGPFQVIIRTTHCSFFA